MDDRSEKHLPPVPATSTRGMSISGRAWRFLEVVSRVWSATATSRMVCGHGQYPSEEDNSARSLSSSVPDDHNVPGAGLVQLREHSMRCNGFFFPPPPHGFTHSPETRSATETRRFSGLPGSGQFRVAPRRARITPR